ncbi:MAG TPA: FtsX-like permease family protein [Steroidobacteraceae bacterium]|jgi:putative ABC transport system permease protein|nr:FtsX-like permease family protein [Steroidobacteraceae bacterium]
MKRYLAIALRQLAREKLYALLNVSGLALGLACCLMLGLYLWGELTYDQHHVNHERIYRVATHFKYGDGRSSDMAITSSPFGPMIAAEYPEYFKSYTRFRALSRPNPTLFRFEDQKAYWNDVYLADKSAFELFTHEIVYGDPRTALKEPASIAISRRMAQRYFGNENPVGRVITMDEWKPLNVTLVFEDLPQNSHLRYDALVSYFGVGGEVPTDFTERLQRLLSFGNFEYTYVELADGADPREYTRLSEAFNEKYTKMALQSAKLEMRSWIEPLADVHLDAELDYDQPHGNRMYLYAFAAVAVLILCLACINYVNLATARAAQRTRAIGLRKILGAGRGSLIAQSLGESVLFALLATVLGVMLVEVLTSLPAVSALFGKTLTLDLFGRPWLALSVLAFGLCVGLAAGLYPAVYQSSFMPLTALVGRYRPGGLRLREALVFTQFAISIGVIACTLLMGQQMRFIASKGLGFDKENRVLLTLRGRELVERESFIANELKKHPGVLGVATSGTIMGRDMPHVTGKAENNEGVMTDLGFSFFPVGDDFMPVMGIGLVEGRDFSRRLLTDVGAAYIVNEAFVRAMGWDKPLGKRVGISPAGVYAGPVIGVVKDFNYKSLRTSIEPLAFVRNFDQNDARLMVVNIAPEGIRENLQNIRKLFAQLDPAHPFEYTFLDDDLDRLYVSEQRLMRLTTIFAAVCILVACLGLFGLAASATEQRTKEIGIRKVLGASTLTIILLLARRVLVLIAAGAVVASIIAWLAMQEWLAGFAYRASLNPAYLLLAALGAGAVALLTIALQSWRTAHGDPIEALRYE